MKRNHIARSIDLWRDSFEAQRQRWICFANSQAICTSFKVELLNGIHALGTTVVRGGTGADTFKAALFLASASIGAGTTAYSATGEVSGTNYTAGGVTLT